MKKYFKTHAKHILLCLLYAVLTCAQQMSNVEPHLFYSVFPLFTLYYGVLSIPKVHQLHEYNSVEQTIPKWTYLLRGYYHIVLLQKVPYAGVLSVFLMIILMMWKDMRFLVMHAEDRLKRIDELMYATPETKAFRFCHFHLKGFDDDIAVRSHMHYFNTNKLNLVKHSFQSEEQQNAIKNYVDYRKTHIFPPTNMKEWETRVWNISDYKYIFLYNRDMYRFVPIIYILGGTFLCFSISSTQFVLYLYLNSILFIGDTVSTVVMQQLNNDIFNDILYAFCAVSFLLINSTTRH